MAAQVALRRDEEEVPIENGLIRNTNKLSSSLHVDVSNQDTVSSSTEKGNSFSFYSIVHIRRKASRIIFSNFFKSELSYRPFV